MNADRIKANYRQHLKQSVVVRRYNSSGVLQSSATARANVTRKPPSQQLTGSVVQHDYEVIMYADDISTGGVSLPLRGSDRVYVSDEAIEIAIRTIIPRRAPVGTLVAYEAHCRG